MADLPKQIPATTLASSGAKTHRQPTEAELKIHREEQPKILAGIKKSHGATMRKVKNMMANPIYVDRGS